MSDIRLFKLEKEIEELPSTSVALERELQTLIESNMLSFFGVNFLKTEFVTSNGGRIDSLGVDENYCPVIFEYKRSSNENVINQGLFYLDWLLDHKADFELLVMNKLGKEMSDKLDWSMPRLICVAGNFTKYDEYAVKQINRNIDLVRYKKFGKELIMFELINSNTIVKDTVVKGKTDKQPQSSPKEKSRTPKTFEDDLATTTDQISELYFSIRNYILSLGDDLAENQLKYYVAFKKMKNVICAEIYQKQIILYLHLDPDMIELEEGFSRDLRGIKHFATGDLQVNIKNNEDFEKAKPIINLAYESN